jgi:hypothetical protein
MFLFGTKFNSKLVARERIQSVYNANRVVFCEKVHNSKVVMADIHVRIKRNTWEHRIEMQMFM